MGKVQEYKHAPYCSTSYAAWRPSLRSIIWKYETEVFTKCCKHGNIKLTPRYAPSRFVFSDSVLCSKVFPVQQENSIYCDT